MFEDDARVEILPGVSKLSVGNGVLESRSGHPFCAAPSSIVYPPQNIRGFPQSPTIRVQKVIDALGSPGVAIDAVTV